MRIILLLWLAAFVCACNNQKDPNILVLGTTPTYPPYESIGENGDCIGFDIDIAQAIAKKLGKKLVIKDLGFDALILALNQGKIDFIMSGMSITPSRKNKIAMIPYQGEAVISLYLVSWQETPSEDFATVGSVAVQVGTFQETYLQAQGIAIKSLEGNIEIIMDLQHKKSKAAIFEPQIAKAMKERFPELQWREHPLEQDDWVYGNGIGIKKDNFGLIEKISAALEELKAEGVIQTAEQKWMAK